MNWKNALLVLLFVDFVAFTAYTIAVEGVVGFVQMIPLSLWTLQVTFDLVIALGLVLIWMVQDARGREIRALPFVALTLCLGSIGPLAYLIRREVFAGHSARHATVAA
jgi:hypothetical protein